MTLKPIRRILTLSMLSISALASMASPAIPVQPVFLVSPDDGGTVAYGDDFSWTDVGADTYIVKFTIVATGQKLKQTFEGESCGIDECSLSLYKTPLFTAVKDGQTVKWRVIAKHDGYNVKSVVRTVTVDTVYPPTTTPANGAMIGSGEPLSWTNHPINQSYTLIVRHVGTGEAVIKETVLAGECIWLCSIEPHALADLQNGAQYKWFVKATGFNGSKAKSLKHTFTVPVTEITN